MHIKVTVCISDQLQSVGGCCFLGQRKLFEDFHPDNYKKLEWLDFISRKYFEEAIHNVKPTKRKRTTFYLFIIYSLNGKLASTAILRVGLYFTGRRRNLNLPIITLLCT